MGIPFFQITLEHVFHVATQLAAAAMESAGFIQFLALEIYC